MNGQEKSDIKLVLQEVKQGNKERGQLIEKVDKIYICLNGDPEDHEDLGMQGAVVENSKFRKESEKDVVDNTKFRKSSKYWLSIIGGTSLAVGIKTFWKSIFPS